MQKLQVTNGVIKKYYIVGVKRIIYLFFGISFVCNIIPIYVKILREYNFNKTVALSTFIVFTHYDCLILVNVHLMTRSAAQNIKVTVWPITKFDNDRHVKTVKI